MQTVSIKISQLFGPENHDLIRDFDDFLPGVCVWCVCCAQPYILSQEPLNISLDFAKNKNIQEGITMIMEYPPNRM